jgi:hypothetical protein
LALVSRLPGFSATAFVGHGQQSLAQIHQSVETNLELATHAETWEWKEMESS